MTICDRLLHTSHCFALKNLAIFNILCPAGDSCAMGICLCDIACLPHPREKDPFFTWLKGQRKEGVYTLGQKIVTTYSISQKFVRLLGLFSANSPYSMAAGLLNKL